LGGGGGPFWLHRETLTFKVPAAYQTHDGISDRSEQNSSKIQHIVMSLEVIQLFEGFTVGRL